MATQQQSPRTIAHVAELLRQAAEARQALLRVVRTRVKKMQEDDIARWSYADKTQIVNKVWWGYLADLSNERLLAVAQSLQADGFLPRD